MLEDFILELNNKIAAKNSWGKNELRELVFQTLLEHNSYKNQMLSLINEWDGKVPAAHSFCKVMRKELLS